MELQAFLSRCDALTTMTAVERQSVIELGEIVNYDAEAEIITEGKHETCFYILLDGCVRVLKDGEEIAILNPGTFIGEMALFNDNRRTSAVVSLSHTTLLRIESTDFSRQVLHQESHAVKMMEFLGRLMVERLQSRDSALLKLVGPKDRELAETLEEFGQLKRSLLHQWSLRYHSIGRPGKLAITATKPVGTTADLSVAYSPGVADPCLEIAQSPERSYDYTARGQLVGVITNGSAVLGLGNIGPAAAKPVMEGKAVLFKRFADLDSFDIEVDAKDADQLIDVVCSLAPTFGGINLEDISAPDCFRVEETCKERLDIPVFHDDQHGTAIISGAGLLNALELVNKRIEDLKVVFAGAGAAGFACAKYFVQLGVRKENLILTDIDGVVYEGRGDDNYLSELASTTSARTLAEAIQGADAFVGVSAAGVLKPEMLLSMNDNPIVFALANPVPEIDYGLARQTRSDVVMATGRSDYPNQINNVIAFPYIFRGALDTRSRKINDAMKIAATKAIAGLAKKDVHPAVLAKVPGLTGYGRDYLIPKPFDPRLLVEVPSAVAAAAIETGIARIVLDLDGYRQKLARLAH